MDHLRPHGLSLPHVAACLSLLVAASCASTSAPALPNYGWQVASTIHGGLSHLGRRTGPALVDGRPADEWYIATWEQRFDSALDFGFNGSAQLGLMRFVYPAGEAGATWERPLLGSIAIFRHARPEQQRYADAWTAEEAEAIAAAGLEPKTSAAPLGLWGFTGFPEGVVQQHWSGFSPPAPPAALLVETTKPNEYLLAAEGRYFGHVLVLDQRFWDQPQGLLPWGELTGHGAAPRDLDEARAAGADLLARLDILRGCEFLGDEVARGLAALEADLVAAEALIWNANQDWLPSLADLPADPAAAYAELLELGTVPARLQHADGRPLEVAFAARGELFDAWHAKLSAELQHHDQLASKLYDMAHRNLTWLQVGDKTPEEARSWADEHRVQLAKVPAFLATDGPTPLERMLARLRWADANLDLEVELENELAQAVSTGVWREADKLLEAEPAQGGFEDVAYSCVASQTYSNNDQAFARGTTLGCLENLVTLQAFLGIDDARGDEVFGQLGTVQAALERAAKEARIYPYRRLPEQAAPLVGAKLARAAGSMAPSPERAVAEALGTVLARGDSDDALSAVAPTLARLKAFGTPSGDLHARLAAFESLATTDNGYGNLLAEATANLAVPLGRELAQQAAAAQAAGSEGLAALFYYRAATIGLATEAAPLRAGHLFYFLDVEGLKRALNGADAPEGAAARADWLTAARLAGAAAVSRSLPRVAPSDPARNLATEFVGAQLSARTELARSLGLRLDSLGDIAGPSDAMGAWPEFHLVTTADGPRWAEVGEGIALDLTSHKIDTDGWARLRALRADLEQSRANVDAAWSAVTGGASGLDGPSAQLARELADLQAATNGGQNMTPSDRAKLEELQRRNRAIASATANVSQAAKHHEEVQAAFNERVREHNELLVELKQQRATGFTELLLPATRAFVDERLVDLGLDADELAARRWLLGFGEQPALVPRRPTHPDSLAGLVRDLNDPEAAAVLLRDAAREAMAHPSTRLPEGNEVAQLERLAPAFEAFLTSYGSQCFPGVLGDELLLRDVRLVNAATHTMSDDERRGVLGALGL